MKLTSLASIIILFGLFASIQSCSVTPTNTDLKEYGYKGAVKSIRSVTYRGLDQKNGEWVLEESKISNITKLFFNEKGNITKVETTFPKANNDVETTIFEFIDERKSAFYKLNALNDTTERGTYKWISDFEYELIIELPTGAKVESSSKLNENYRDLSGGYKYVDGDSTVYEKSYENEINKKGLITKIKFIDKLSNAVSFMTMSYEDFDAEGNPQKVILFDDEANSLDNLSKRKFEYYD